LKEGVLLPNHKSVKTTIAAIGLAICSLIVLAPSAHATDSAQSAARRSPAVQQSPAGALGFMATVVGQLQDFYVAHTAEQEELRISNPTHVLVHVHLKAVTAENGVNGVLLYDAPETPGAITGLPQIVTLKPGQSRMLTFSVIDPKKNAGTWLGGIVLQNPASTSSGSIQSVVPGKKVQVNLAYRRVIAVEESRSGGATYGAHLTRASLKGVGQIATLSVHGVNTSNFLLSNVTGTLRLWQGAKGLGSRININGVFIKGPFDLQADWSKGVYPSPGMYRVHVILRAGAHLLLNQWMPFRVTAQRVAAIQSGALTLPATSVTPAPVTNRILSMVIGGLALLIFLLVVLWLLATRRKRKRKADQYVDEGGPMPSRRLKHR